MKIIKLGVVSGAIIVALGLCAAHFTKSSAHSDETVMPMITFSGEITETSANSFIKLVHQVDAMKPNALVIRFSSEGGSLLDAYRMVDALKTAPYKTICVVTGEAASAGLVVIQGCSERVAEPYALFLIHLPSIQSGGNIEHLKNSVALLEAVNKSYALSLAQRSKMSVDLINSLMAEGKEAWFTSDQALVYGLIDRII